MKKKIDIPGHITDALTQSPIDYLAKWWSENSTEAERIEAEERDATIEGAYAFIEHFAKRAKHNNGACLPDAITYELCGIFMRVCVDGDVYATAEEIAEEERREADRKASEKKRQAEIAERKAQAEKAESERIASMSDEEREVYEAELAQRKEKEKADEIEAERKKQEQKLMNDIKRKKEEELARKKALAEEIKNRQLTFDF